MKRQGFFGIRPVIKKIEFVQKGTFSLFLKDGRVIVVPLAAFPSIKKLSGPQRKQWYILEDVGFSFDECDEVFHLEDVLGNFERYQYSFLPRAALVAETASPYGEEIADSSSKSRR